MYSGHFESFDEAPADFCYERQAAGVVIECRGKVLMTQRHPDKSYGLMWGIPGGKLEMGEVPVDGAIREIEEEVGVLLEEASFVGVKFCRILSPRCDYLFHVFHVVLEEFPLLLVKEDENVDAKWLEVEKALRLPLICGGREVLELFKRGYEKE